MPRLEEVGRVAFCWLQRLEVIYFGIFNKGLGILTKIMEFASQPGLKAQMKQHVIFYLNSEQWQAA